MALDSDVARQTTFGARLSNRLARHLARAPMTLGLDAPLVSITFDDVPDSACTTGADLLEAYGATGTYYVAGGLIGTQGRHWRLADDAAIAGLHARGHEIGCHTLSHAFVPDLAPKAFDAEIRANRARLRAIVPELDPESFAFPYGFGSPRAKRALRPLYGSSRGIRPGVNAGRIDRHYLRSNPLIDASMDAGRIARLMDEAVARNGWLIFYGHDVAENASPYGCAPALLETALEAARARGIACLGVAQALARAEAGAR